jgi:hypothetical protein
MERASESQLKRNGLCLGGRNEVPTLAGAELMGILLAGVPDRLSGHGLWVAVERPRC